MLVKERLVKYIKYKGISNSEFCRRIGVSAAFVSSMRKSIQPNKIDNIALVFPDLNTGWLLTGEGCMLRHTSVVYPTNYKSEGFVCDVTGKYDCSKQESEGANKEQFAENLKIELYKQGEIYPSEVVARMMAEKEARIEELQKRIWTLEYENELLRSK